MELKAKYFKERATIVVVECDCSLLILHDVRRTHVRCNNCNIKVSLNELIGELLETVKEG